jgi:hypothetical protein
MLWSNINFGWVVVGIIAIICAAIVLCAVTVDKGEDE